MANFNFFLNFLIQKIWKFAIFVVSLQEIQVHLYLYEITC